jgi:hypothetical protein
MVFVVFRNVLPAFSNNPKAHFQTDVMPKQMGFRAANHCDTSAQTSGDSAADGSMNGVNTGSDII